MQVSTRVRRVGVQPQVPRPHVGEVYLRRGDQAGEVQRAEDVGGAQPPEGVLGGVEGEAGEAAVGGGEGGEEGEEGEEEGCEGGGVGGGKE